MNTERAFLTPSQLTAVRDHRRQTFWQILFPVILAGVILVAVTVFLVVTTRYSGSTLDTRWANISLIWLLLPSIAFSVILLALLGGLIFLMVKALNGLPKFGAKAQYYAVSASQIVRNFSDKVSSPVIGVKGAWAGLQDLVIQIRKLFTRK
jgi:hypothetical protein